ncbi:glycosyltransferase family 4 protein [Ectopseudomonas hydrolytica]|uniref:Glycosyltransferase family 4 protein n=1 Tax=Ectopseudomonas hydrolytica TaxID=2493633 RepID=A0ABY5AE98_9GAMM|nr:glycosyltransferase family 4 protein [Pseudomonas hydrolytica]USR41526.1 glycosyltransferase family 4 protein [Pseudomonas hydrolytica]
MLGLSPKKLYMRLYWALRWRTIKFLIRPARRLIRARERVLGWRFRDVLDAYETQGIDIVCVMAEALKNQSLRAKAYRVLAKRELARDVLSAAKLARRSLALDASQENRVRNCMTLWDAGSIQEASSLLDGLSDSVLSFAEQEKALQIRGAQLLYTSLPEIPTAAAPSDYVADPHCVLYVASSSRPYHTTGYTTRTHHLLESLRVQGWAVHCVTRPGYPADRPDSRNTNAPALNIIDGVPYERLQGRHRREVRYDLYLTKAAAELERAARRLRPAVIHAASNYEAALPALIAARRLGLPFCYEVRGLWEYTASSKKAGWEQTERFALDRMLEAHTAAHADKVFTLTKALATELVRRGVAEERIELLPNAVNLEFFKPLEPDRALAQQLGLGPDTFVCGYVGSVVKYEGLDDLITAMPALLRRVPDSRLLVVGDGDELANLREQAARLGVSAQVIFTGRVSHAEVTRYFSLLSAIALPRKPYTVCKLVSPLKPFEAMAMRVPLVVSDVDALGEIFEQGETALLHRAGDANSLAEAMIRLAESPALRQRLADNAFTQVSRHGQWSQVIRPLGEFYAANGVHSSSKSLGKPVIRVLSVGSLPPEWGGGTGGGVASIHKVVLEQWLAEQGDSSIELVGVLANNWSGQIGSEMPSELCVFEPPKAPEEHRQWYCDLLQRERIDCVLFFHIAHRWAYWHAQLCSDVRSVGAVHSWHAVTMQADQDQAAQVREKIRQALPQFTALIFPSAHCAGEGRILGFDYSTVPVVIPNAIGSEFFNEPLRVENANVRIVFVGSLIARKRVDLLISAASTLGIELLVIGDGEERTELELLAKASTAPESIRFLGRCPPSRIAAEIAQSSLLCVPSTSESFGIVYLEALACGVPVVGFAPTLSEIAAELGVPIGAGVDGDAGLPELIEALRTVLRTPYDPQRLRDVVAGRYGAQQVAAGYRYAVERALIER